MQEFQQTISSIPQKTTGSYGVNNCSGIGFLFAFISNIRICRPFDWGPFDWGPFEL